MFAKILRSTKSSNSDQRRAAAYRDLIRAESQIGGQLFGPIPKGHRREFFCLDRHTWVWHEEWKDDRGKWQVRTTRYEVRPSGVVKIQDGNVYKSLSQTELHNLRVAAELYAQRVAAELYS